MSRTAQLKGFRPGKVPVKVIRQQFGQQVRQEVLTDVVQSSFAEAVNQEKLSPAAGPRIEPINLARRGSEVPRGVRGPAADRAPKVDGLTVTRPTAEVTEADVDAMIENLREQRPRFVAVERESRDGDRVTMDFTGQIDGQPFEGSKGDNVSVLLGGGRMLKDFEAGVTGARAGERRTIDVRYPDDYHNKDLAGRIAQFDIDVKPVEEKHLPELDDEFCREYGVIEGGIEQLRERSRGQHASRAHRERPRARQAAGARPAARGQSDRGAARPGRCAGARAADRRGASHGCQGRIAAAAARAVRRAARRRVALGLLVGELIKQPGHRARSSAGRGTLPISLPVSGPGAGAQGVSAERRCAAADRESVLEDQVVD